MMHSAENTPGSLAGNYQDDSTENKSFMSVKKPKSPHDSVYTFWYRVLIICACIAPAWLLIFILSLFNQNTISTWMTALISVIFFFPLMLSERIRQTLFEQIIRQKGETVDVYMGSAGMRITSKDEKLIEDTIKFNPNIVHDSFYNKFGKRLIDVLVCGIVLVPLSPVLILIYTIIYFSGGSPLYRQYRVGKNGKIFKLYKFRTLVSDADTVLEEHILKNPIARAEWDLTQVLRDDPRITNFGIFLRKSSFDELPQLWNVFRGDMSIVGPRPMMIEQASLYPGKSYYRLRPGITGIWQISDRADSTFATRSTLDEIYAQRASLLFDLKIIAKTFIVVLRGIGY